MSYVQSDPLELSQFQEQTEGSVAVTFGVRCGSRECLNQVEVTVEAIVALREIIGKRFCAILDGSQVSGHALGTHRGIDVSQERSVIRKICDALEGVDVKIIPTTDFTFKRSVLYVASSAFLVAPWGAGLVKTCWIGRVPGIVYGNHYILDGADRNQGEYSLYHSPHWVEAPALLEFLPSAAIRTEVAETADGKFNRFEMDVDAVGAFIRSHASFIKSCLE